MMKLHDGGYIYSHREVKSRGEKKPREGYSKMLCVVYVCDDRTYTHAHTHIHTHPHMYTQIIERRDRKRGKERERERGQKGKNRRIYT